MGEDETGAIVATVTTKGHGWFWIAIFGLGEWFWGEKMVFGEGLKSGRKRSG